MSNAVPEVSRTSTPLLSASWNFASVCSTQKAVVVLIQRSLPVKSRLSLPDILNESMQPSLLRSPSEHSKRITLGSSQQA